ncbi:MAG: hypothetical protein WC341_02675 [Bacteroidales bacterium]
MKRKTALFIAFFTLVILNACYYDSEEALYPQNNTCDTTNVTYSKSVFPIISANCVGCHTGFGANGNTRLDSYDNVVTAANNGSLLGTIQHQSGWPGMPKDMNKLDDCSIKKIEIWVAAGTPNN